MAAFILGTKTTQSQWFDEQKLRRNSTTITVGDCYVVWCKTKERDGYFSIVLGTQTKEPRNITKSLLGQTKKAGITTPLNFFKEVRIPQTLSPSYVEEEGKKGIKIGDTLFYIGMKILPSSIFKAGDLVSVTSRVKGM